VIGTAVSLALGLSGTEGPAGAPRVEDALDVAPVWSAHPVGFALLTEGTRQFVAFYDSERRATVAARRLDEREWRFVRLPMTTGWDSHNSLTMAVDDDGYLHLTGNMHSAALTYFRTTRPYDITSFERIPRMVGGDEERCTYPVFLRGPRGALLFTYRSGSSGNGNQIYNVYDDTTRKWRRLLDRPLTDGEGQRNAYFDTLRRGPDGYFHLCWVWRETPDCATNHDPSYARSQDLEHWQTSGGQPLALPITLQTSETVDRVPVAGGVINGNVHVGFDTQQRPIVSFHKYDAQGRTQLYNARRERDGWKVYQTSDWHYRWEFRGGGSIPFEIRVGAVQVEPDGRLSQSYSHVKHGAGTWLLDEATLKPIGQLQRPGLYPPALSQPASDFPGMKVNWSGDLGKSAGGGGRYVLRWETLGPNRDRPRAGPLPAATMLRVYRLGPQ
jgi:hypothetical protein